MKSHAPRTTTSTSTSTASTTRSASSAPASTSNSEMQDQLREDLDQETLARSELVTELPGANGHVDGNVAVAKADHVEDRSNKDTRDSNKSYQAMNEDRGLGYTFDHAEAGTPGSTGIHVNFDGDTGRKREAEVFDETGVSTLTAYKRMISKDFNFSGIVTKFAGSRGDRKVKEHRAAGEQGFLAAVIGRFYPGAKIDDDKVAICKEIARNIWSYATTGADYSGTTDIAELQGLLYVFDKQIKASSNTNTTMEDGKQSDDYFVVPGTEDWETPIKLLKGDGLHGRATILTTRHLLSGMVRTPPDQSLEGFEETYMLMDKSGSMLKDEYLKLAKLIKAGGVDGDVALAAFDDDGSSIAKVQGNKPLTKGDAQALLSKTSKEAIAQQSVKFNDKEWSEDATPLAAKSGHGNEEQGLSAALTWAKSLPTQSNTKRQMVVVTDEPDFNPTVFDQLKALAATKNLSIKVLYSFNDKALNGSYGEGAATDFMIIDIMAISSLQKKWMVDREGTQQLDWQKVGTSQRAETQSWSEH